MTETELWWLTLDFFLVALLVGGGGYLWARHIARRFDREFGDNQHRQPGE